MFELKSRRSTQRIATSKVQFHDYDSQQVDRNVLRNSC